MDDVEMGAFDIDVIPERPPTPTPTRSRARTFAGRRSSTPTPVSCTIETDCENTMLNECLS